MSPATQTELKQQEARRLLRLFLNDTAELNRLIRQEETDDARLDLAIRLAVDDWNITLPILGNVTVANHPSIYLLIHGAAIQVLKSAGLLQARNQLDYQAGNLTVRLYNKSQLYQQWLSQFAQDYEMKKINLKKYTNIDGGWSDGIPSEYASIGWYTDE